MSWQHDPASPLNLNSISKDQAPESRKESTKDALAEKTIPSNSSFTALIVDDNVSFQKLMALCLSMHPQIGEINCVNSGESAIEQAKIKQYDLIFMDADMPGIDGYEACSRLRENPTYKNTPIIMVTGMNSPLDEAKGIIAGTTNYVTKPVQQLPFKELLTRELSMLDYRRNNQTR